MPSGRQFAMTSVPSPVIVPPLRERMPLIVKVLPAPIFKVPSLKLKSPNVTSAESMLIMPAPSGMTALELLAGTVSVVQLALLNQSEDEAEAFHCCR
jgi:hypothetical protein